MGTLQSMLRRNSVKETEAFKSLSTIQQKFALNHNNMKALDHALKVVENTSYEQWEKESAARYYNKAIIKELTQSN